MKVAIEMVLPIAPSTVKRVPIDFSLNLIPEMLRPQPGCSCGRDNFYHVDPVSRERKVN
jgi:hypothetical protein